MFTMADTAATITASLVQGLINAGVRVLALYGNPSAGWSEVHAASDGEWAAAGRMPGGCVLIHFGPDASQAIAQADHLRSIGVPVHGIAADKEYNDTRSYAAFCAAVTATGRYISIEYGTVAGVSADAHGALSYWLAEPGWRGIPGSRYAVQNGQISVQGTVFDVSVCADDFLAPIGQPTPGPSPVLTEVHDMGNITKLSASVYWNGSEGWFTLPPGVGNIVSVNVYGRAPEVVGRVVPVPIFMGLAQEPGRPVELVFCAPPGGCPQDNYGFDVWYVS